MIEVRLFATFREGREKILFYEPGGIATAGDVLLRLAIPAEDVAILLVNGRHSAPGTAVADGDVLALFPPVGGG